MQQERRIRMGVLSLPLTPNMKTQIKERVKNGSIDPSLAKKLLKGSSIPPSIVDWLRAGGIEAVFLDFYRSKETIAALDELDGLLLTGGGVWMFDKKTLQPTPYLLLINELMQKAKKVNQLRVFPVWGICLGFEAMLVVENGLQQCLQSLGGQNCKCLSLSRIQEDSSMFEFFDVKTLAEPNFHYHHKFGIKTEDWKLFPNVTLTSEMEFGGTTWAASFAYKHFPFFGVQFHPEVFHFEPKEDIDNIDYLNKRSTNTKWALLVAKSCKIDSDKISSTEKKFHKDETLIENLTIYPKLIILHN